VECAQDEEAGLQTKELRQINNFVIEENEKTVRDFKCGETSLWTDQKMEKQDIHFMIAQRKKTGLSQSNSK